MLLIERSVCVCVCFPLTADSTLKYAEKMVFNFNWQTITVHNVWLPFLCQAHALRLVCTLPNIINHIPLTTQAALMEITSHLQDNIKQNLRVRFTHTGSHSYNFTPPLSPRIKLSYWIYKAANLIIFGVLYYGCFYFICFVKCVCFCDTYILIFSVLFV
jgi:hypothetical protein